MTRIINQLPPQLRAVIGVLLGTTTGFAVMTAIRAVIPYQPPAGVSVTENTGQYNKWIEGLPTEGYLYIFMAFMVSALVAGAIAGYFVLGTRYKIAPHLAGFILLILSVGNFLAFNHPEWLTYISCIGFPVVAWLGGWIVRRVNG